MGTNLFGQKTINIRQLAKILRYGKSLLCHNSLLPTRKLKKLLSNLQIAIRNFGWKLIFSDKCTNQKWKFNEIKSLTVMSCFLVKCFHTLISRKFRELFTYLFILELTLVQKARGFYETETWTNNANWLYLNWSSGN